MSMTRHEIIQTVRPLNTWILFRLDFGPFVVNCESYTESNESLKITRLRNPIVCSGLLLKQAQAYIYILLIASGIDKTGGKIRLQNYLRS
jgi:hypothetical protein